MFGSGFTKELLDTVRKLSALEVRTEDVMRGLLRIEEKINSMNDRITRLELNQAHLKESVRDSILADLKAEMAMVKLQHDAMVRSASGTNGNDHDSPAQPRLS